MNDIVWSFLWKYVCKLKVLFITTLLMIIISETMVRFSLYFGAQIVGILSSYSDKGLAFNKAIVYSLIISVLFLLRACGRNLMNIFEARYIPQIQALINKDLFSHVHKHSNRFFAEEMSGTISSKISMIAQSANQMYFLMNWGFLMPVFGIFLTFAFIFRINIELSLVVLLFSILIMFSLYKFSKKMIPTSQKRAKISAATNGALVDSLANASLVKSFSNYFYEKKYFFSYLRQSILSEQADTVMFAKLSFSKNILLAFLQIIFYTLPLWYWYKGEIDIAEFVLMQSLIFALASNYEFTTSSFLQLFRFYGKIKDGLILLYTPHEIVDIDAAKPLKIKSAKISFDKINYHYKEGNALFNGFGLEIKSGEKVGLVGESGAGKSTLINLLSRNYDLQQGKILINGHDIKKVTLHSLRKHIAVIPQDTALFNRSIMDNIRYGNISASDADVINAAKQAKCYDFILRLPNGFESKVGERGVMLSGGERQRIAIARAILKNAPILILDEATSALDSESEKYIQSSLNNLMKGKTVIVIAHRLSTLREMDKIVVMEKGCIIEEGSHEALLDAKGRYYGFYKLQSEGFIGCVDAV